MVSVEGSRTAANGRLPTGTVASTRHPETTVASQRAASITSMACPTAGGEQKLVAHWIGTYTVSVCGFAAGTPGLPLSRTEPRCALEAPCAAAITVVALGGEGAP